MLWRKGGRRPQPMRDPACREITNPKLQTIQPFIPVGVAYMRPKDKTIRPKTGRTCASPTGIVISVSCKRFIINCFQECEKIFCRKVAEFYDRVTSFPPFYY